MHTTFDNGRTVLPGFSISLRSFTRVQCGAFNAPKQTSNWLCDIIIIIINTIPFISPLARCAYRRPHRSAAANERAAIASPAHDPSAGRAHR